MVGHRRTLSGEAAEGDLYVENAHVVGTPGSGFGAQGEGYFRLTAFGTYENTLEAISRIEKEVSL